MVTTTLRKLTRAEVKKLKKYAKPEELARLDWETFNPESSERCIYGQMTGICASRRASLLIKKCCTKVYKDNDAPRYTNDSDLNGKPQGYRSMENIKFWSPLEVFIAKKESQDNGDNRNIIAYLKGQAKTLSI